MGNADLVCGGCHRIRHHIGDRILVLAAALVRNPALLVLDEATSHLDAESERIIQTNFNTILRDRTTIIIAHRLSTVQRVDKILILDEPTAGMARHDTNRTIELLKKIKEGGMTKIIIEHDMHVVFSLADHISVLAQGAIIAEGKPEEIKGHAKVREAYLGTAEL